MNRRPFQTEDEGSFLLDIFRLALGVFIGSLAAVFTYEAVVEYRIEQAARKATAEFNRLMKETNDERECQRLAEQLAREQADQAERQKRSALALADRLERERKTRKNAAWESFYQPSPACKADSGTAACANEYMAARKRFDGQYVDR